jgi:hypothetical protein
MHPRAVDYLRFLNARALLHVVREENGDKKAIGRYFLLHYGRRHLYPPSVNDKLREYAVLRFGENVVKYIEGLIDEFLRLSLPAQMARAFAIASAIANYDQMFSKSDAPPIRAGDPRGDCCPMHGVAQLDAGTANKLRREIRALVQRPTRTPEPKEKPSPQDQSPSPKSQSSSASAEEEETPATATSPEPPPTATTAETSGGETTTPQEKPTPETLTNPSGHPEEKEDEPEEKGEDHEETGTGSSDEDEGDEEDEEESGEGDGDTPLQAESGEGEGDEADAWFDEEDRPGSGAGWGQTDDVGEMSRTIRNLADSALDKVRDEVEKRYEALTASELAPQLGGSRKKAVEPENIASANKLSRIFREINQDLVTTMERGHRRGRLDARRLSVAMAANSDRIFRRRIKDLSPDAALAVHVAIDTSSSMYDRPIDLGDWSVTSPRPGDVAIAAGFALAKGVELAGHIAKVSTYSDGDVVHKRWLDEQYRALARVHHGGTNPELLLRRSLLDFPYLERELEIHNHVLIIITDGDWQNEEVCETLLKELVKRGVHLIEIGIGIEPKAIPGAWRIVTISSVQDLSHAMVDPLRKLAVEIAKNVRRRVA